MLTNIRNYDVEQATVSEINLTMVVNVEDALSVPI